MNFNVIVKGEINTKMRAYSVIFALKKRWAHIFFALAFEKNFRGGAYTRRGVEKFGMDYFCVWID